MPASIFEFSWVLFSVCVSKKFVFLSRTLFSVFKFSLSPSVSLCMSLSVCLSVWIVFQILFCSNLTRSSHLLKIELVFGRTYVLFYVLFLLLQTNWRTDTPSYRDGRPGEAFLDSGRHPFDFFQNKGNLFLAVFVDILSLFCQKLFFLKSKTNRLFHILRSYLYSISYLFVWHNWFYIVHTNIPIGTCMLKNAPWFRTAKNRDGPLAFPFARSLAPLTYSLGPHCLLRSLALLCHLFTRSLVHSLPKLSASEWVYFSKSVLNHSGTERVFHIESIF